MSIIIAGGGLAGSCAALYLSQTHHVTVVAGSIVGSASAVGAGLVNPMLGRQAKRVWRADDAIGAFNETVRAVGAEPSVARLPILRPARDAKQQRKFVAAAGATHLGEWLEAAQSAESYPGITAPLGALRVAGAAVDIPEFCERVLSAAEANGARVLRERRITSWSSTERGGVSVGLDSGEPAKLEGSLLLLCTGAASPSLLPDANLSLHLIKGQTVQTDRPSATDGWPHLAGAGYVAMYADHLILGSSYEHSFTSAEPTAEATATILEKAGRLAPSLRGLGVREVRAGGRVTVPRSYLPMIGPVPGQHRVWIFTGLGSKGLLMAPLLASELPAYVSDDRTIPVEVRPR